MQQFEAGHVRDEVAERCHARRGSRPSWRSGETTGNQLKYLEPAKDLVKHVDQRFAQVRELITMKIVTLIKITGQDHPVDSELVHGTIQCLDYQTAVQGLEK